MKHLVGFSGGIDSQACALWVRERLRREVLRVKIRALRIIIFTTITKGATPCNAKEIYE